VAAGVSGDNTLIKTHGAINATRNPRQIPADATVCARSSAVRTLAARTGGATGEAVRTEFLRIKTVVRVTRVPSLVEPFCMDSDSFVR
jgi:hypothetical protein